MSVEVQFIGEEAQRFYKLTGAPLIEQVGAMRLTIQPTGLTILVRDGRVCLVEVVGITQRHDSKRGAPREVVWTRPVWDDMPEWVAKIVASTGIPLEGRAR